MKLDELSFAAQVLEMANKICEADFQAYKASMDQNSPESKAKMQAWMSENSALSYVPRALALITRAASRISQIQSEDR